MNKMMSFSEGGITSKVIAKTDKNEYTLFCMAKGSSLSEHTSTRNASVMVLKGRGIFTLDGEEIQMEPGVLILMLPNAKHALNAEEDLAFLLSLS